MAFAAKLYRDARSSDRVAVNLNATLRKPSSAPVDVAIEDLSVTGFRLVTDEALTSGAVVTIGISGLGRRAARIVRRDGKRVGCEFLEAVSANELSIALTSQTIVHIDFGAEQTVTEASLPGDGAVRLDIFEQRLRLLRGPIILTGVIAPWAIIAGSVMMLAK